MTGYIHSTESFGTVDGPGIRFVVFFQGCPMRCLYCHNPDTWTVGVGTRRTAESLLSEYEGVKEFLRGGGLTCTGGEPLMQLEFLTELFETAKIRGINTCLDTSGAVFSREREEDYRRLMAVTDLVMLDIKHIDEETHRRITGRSNRNILDFARFVSETGTDIRIRHVLVPGLTDEEGALRRLGAFLADIRTLRSLEVLPYHTMGRAKYEALGLDYPLGDTPPAEKQEAARGRELIMAGLRDELSKRRK